MTFAKKIAFFFIVYRGEEVDDKVFLSKQSKFGNKLLTEFMCKNPYYFIVLEN